MKTKFFILIFHISLFIGNAQNQLKLEDIMKGEAFVGYQPENLRWSLDGQSIYFEWNPKKELGNSTYYWKKGMSKPELANVNDINSQRIRIINTIDKTKVYFLLKGSLYGFNKSTKAINKIIQQANPISNVRITSEAFYYEQNNNVFKLNRLDNSLVQMTNFNKFKPKDKPKDSESFLKNQQKELFQYVRDQDAKKKWNEAKNKQIKADFAKPVYFDKKDLSELMVHPKGKFVTFSITENQENKEETMPVFITSDGFNKTQETKSKVSETNIMPSKLAIFNVEKDSLYYVSFSNLTGIKTKPAYYKEYENLDKKEAVEKAISFGNTLYSEDGKYAVVDIRSKDNKDRWIVSLNLANGSFTEIAHQHDEAWIGGPGIPSYFEYVNGTLGFLADNKTLYFQSEETGYSHLYTYDLETKTKKQLTSGNWEVRKVILSNDKEHFYLSTNTTNPGNRDFYKMPVIGGAMQPIFTANGNHEVELSPDEKTLIVRYSYKNKPWELYVADNVKDSKIVPITQSQTEEFKQYSWRAPEVVTFKAGDGTNVNARIYVPQATVKNGAAVIFVHGAGYLQNAHNWWSSYFREFMFHNLLTDLGYTVLDIDYRASDGYGRDHRTGIYRWMGGKDLSDHVDGKNFLVAKYGIDANRVGIYGGSYGGFITLMAMLTTPKEFKAGCALRSVTDWAHYNHGYTANILNTPELDPNAFKKSSPIYFADKLEGNLLMLHGMVDDNVEYKDIVRLSQRFIELEKKNWHLASYPVEAHSFKETYSWYDEYRRILEFFKANL